MLTYNYAILLFDVLQQVRHDKLQITLILVSNGTQNVSIKELILLRLLLLATCSWLLLPTSNAALLNVHPKALIARERKRALAHATNYQWSLFF